MNFEQKKFDLLSCLRRLRSLAEEAGSSTICPKIDAEIQKLNEERFHLVVLGQFKRGKTTFINAILGEPLLPMAIVPLTSILTLIRHSQQKQVEVIFQDNRKLVIHPSELEEYVTERGNPNNQRRVRYVEIRHPSEFLREGIVLIDTPGIGSLFLHNTETTSDFIPNIDAAIFVLSADPPLTQTEYEFLDDVNKYVRKIFFVLNKVDMLTSNELEEIISYSTQTLKEKFSAHHSEIIPLSARKALEGKIHNNEQAVRQSCLHEVEASIRSFLEDDKGATLLQASKNRTMNRIAELRFTLDLQLKAIQSPLTTLDDKIKEFYRQIESLKKDREHFSYLLKGEVTSLQQWIDEQLGEFRKVATNRLQNMLVNWAHRTTDLSNREFLKEIEQNTSDFLITQFETRRAELEPDLRKHYENIIAEYVQKTNQLINDLLHLSGQLFDVHVTRISDIERLEWKHKFYCTIGRDPLFFDIDTLKLTARFLPAHFVRQRYLKRILTNVEKYVDRNCGGLRYEYAYSIQESHRKFLSELNEKLEEILKEISTVLDAAVRRKQEGKSATEVEVNALRERLHTLEQLERMISQSP